MYTDKTTLARCRERMPALLYNRVSRELVLDFVSCRFVSRTNHTSVGVVRDAIRLRTKRCDQLTKVSKSEYDSNSQKKHVRLAPRGSHGLGLLPRVVPRFCELTLHVSFTSLTEVRVVRDNAIEMHPTHKTLKVS